MNMHIAKAGQNITIIKNTEINDIGIIDTVFKNIEASAVKQSIDGSKRIIFIYIITILS